LHPERNRGLTGFILGCIIKLRDESAKKVYFIFLSLSFCGLTLALAQEENLTELARKERERRESLEG